MAVIRNIGTDISNDRFGINRIVSSVDKGYRNQKQIQREMKTILVGFVFQLHHLFI